MKKRMFIALVFGGLIFLTSCAKDEEWVCNINPNLTESDAKDSGVSLAQACDVAKIGDETCRVE